MHPLAHVARALGFAWILLASTLLVACDRASPPQLISATELSPAEAEVGDRLEVSGSGFPKGKAARLTFRGTLHRPGEVPASTEIEATATTASAQRIEIVLTESLEALCCGRADRARHTTFRGEVEVAFPAITPGAPPVAATLPNVTLDLRPASPSRAVAESRRAEADRVTQFMGLAFEDAPAAAGGAFVRAVAPGSRADAAGIAAGDVVTSFDGVRVLSRDDLIPSGARARVAVGVRRDHAPDMVLDVALDGYRLAAPRDLLVGGLLLAIAAGVVLFFFAPGAGVLAWLERRLAARIVRRPDFRALVARATSSRPTLALVGVAFVLFAVMPFGRYVVLAEVDIALLFLVALTSLVAIGWVTGGLRAAARSVSFEVPAAIAIACVVLMTGSTRLHEIVRAQGGAPWGWYAFRSPIAFGLFALHITSALGQSSRVPGPLPEAETEPVASARGPFATRVSAAFEWANVLVTSGTSAALFLGGWRLPGMTLGQENGHLGLELLGSLVFLAKAGTLVALVTLLRRALPVVKVEQTMRLCWRWLVPAAVVGLALTFGWVAWSPSAMVERVLSMATCALVALACVRFVHNVRFAVRFGATDNPTSAFL